MTELFQDRPIEDQIDELTIQASKLEKWILNTYYLYRNSFR